MIRLGVTFSKYNRPKPDLEFVALGYLFCAWLDGKDVRRCDPYIPLIMHEITNDFKPTKEGDYEIEREKEKEKTKRRR